MTAREKGRTGADSASSTVTPPAAISAPPVTRVSQAQHAGGSVFSAMDHPQAHVGAGDGPVPLFDTAAIHARRPAGRALEGD